MELWIRSQDENSLIKANNIYSDVLPEDGYYKIFNMPNEDILGKYITKERALEVLDEIAAMIKNRYIVKPSGILSTKDMVNEYIRLNKVYNGEFIMENPPFEIEPINSNVIYYEMPKE